MRHLKILTLSAILSVTFCSNAALLHAFPKASDENATANNTSFSQKFSNFFSSKTDGCENPKTLNDDALKTCLTTREKGYGEISSAIVEAEVDERAVPLVCLDAEALVSKAQTLKSKGESKKALLEWNKVSRIRELCKAASTCFERTHKLKSIDDKKTCLEPYAALQKANTAYSLNKVEKRPAKQQPLLAQSLNLYTQCVVGSNACLSKLKKDMHYEGWDTTPEQNAAEANRKS